MSDWTVLHGRSEADQRAVEETEGRKRKLAEQRRVERSAQQCALDQLRAEMRQEIANLRAETHQLHEVAIEAAGDGIGVYADKVIERAEKMVHELERVLYVAIERRFGELQGRLDSFVSGTSPRAQSAKKFEFSNERSDADAIDSPALMRKVN